ncbi:MAG: hypothetical protein JW760_12185, partial [Spirochaetales bacterium]|nr:hypothetical protein [Spirochaetales bacterium]
MYYRDRDRLLLSLLLTLGLYGVLFFILGTLSWNLGSAYPERRGPVMVTLEPRESVPLQPAPPREEEPLPAPPLEQPAVKPRVSREASSASSPPPAAAPAARSVVQGDRSASTEPRSLQSEGPGEAPPLETWESGTFEEEAPIDIRGESRIIYSEETPETPYGTPGEKDPAAKEPADDAFSLEDFNLDRALADTPRGQTGGTG